jgi:hypothetical protein
MAPRNGVARAALLAACAVYVALAGSPAGALGDAPPPSLLSMDEPDRERDGGAVPNLTTGDDAATMLHPVPPSPPRTRHTHGKTPRASPNASTDAWSSLAVWADLLQPSLAGTNASSVPKSHRAPANASAFFSDFPNQPPLLSSPWSPCTSSSAAASSSPSSSPSPCWLTLLEDAAAPPLDPPAGLAPLPLALLVLGARQRAVGHLDAAEGTLRGSLAALRTCGWRLEPTSKESAATSSPLPFPPAASPLRAAACAGLSGGRGTCLAASLLVQQKLLEAERRSAVGGLALLLGDMGADPTQWLWGDDADGGGLSEWVGGSGPPPRRSNSTAGLPCPILHSVLHIVARAEAGDYFGVERVWRRRFLGLDGGGASGGSSEAEVERVRPDSIVTDDAHALFGYAVVQGWCARQKDAFALQRRVRAMLEAQKNATSPSPPRSRRSRFSSSSPSTTSLSLRSRHASGEALLALGQSARAARYFERASGGAVTSPRTLPVLRATSYSLLAAAQEDADFAAAADGCGLLKTGRSVCVEKAAGVAAAKSLDAWSRAVLMWGAAVGPAARRGNTDWAATARRAALANFRATPAVRNNATVVDAAAFRHALGLLGLAEGGWDPEAGRLWAQSMPRVWAEAASIANAFRPPRPPPPVTGLSLYAATAILAADMRTSVTLYHGATEVLRSAIAGLWGVDTKSIGAVDGGGGEPRHGCLSIDLASISVVLFQTFKQYTAHISERVDAAGAGDSRDSNTALRGFVNLLKQDGDWISPYITRTFEKQEGGLCDQRQLHRIYSALAATTGPAAADTSPAPRPAGAAADSAAAAAAAAAAKLPPGTNAIQSSGGDVDPSSVRPQPPFSGGRQQGRW